MGGLPEGIVQDQTGVVVEEISAQALAHALDQLLAHPHHLSVMSAQAATHAARSFRWDSVVQKILALCETVSLPTTMRIPIQLQSPEAYRRDTDLSRTKSN